MTNPTTLQELADSLGVLAIEADRRARRRHEAGQRGPAEYEAGYACALRDVRATVLVMASLDSLSRPTVEVLPPNAGVSSIRITRGADVTRFAVIPNMTTSVEDIAAAIRGGAK